MVVQIVVYVCVECCTVISDHRYTIVVYSQPPTSTQPGHSSLGRCSEYWHWSG